MIEEDDLPLVAASEGDLIATARLLVAPQRFDVWAQLCRSRKLPPAWGETCEALLEDALRQAWPTLWRKNVAPDRDGKRVWERNPMAPLHHSPASAALLRWLTASPFAAPPSAIDKLTELPVALGDHVLLYLALDAATGTPAQATMARQPAFRASPLAWLGFAHLFEGAPPGFDHLVAHGTAVVDALGPELAKRWEAVEISKRSMTAPDRLIALGGAQDATLTAFMRACEKRRDLAAWVIDAAAPLLARDIAPMPAQLDPNAPLSARLAARTAAGALVRGVQAWARWDSQHRGVRFIDDDYDRAQRLLGRFEKIGQAGVDKAAGWLSQLAALA